jgi:hypothetical protein
VILTWKSKETTHLEESHSEQDITAMILVRNGKPVTGHAGSGDRARRSITNK